MNKIVIISDTHGMHKGLDNKFDLPPADFVIHCGDITGSGKEHVVKEFLDWYSKLDQYKYKIFIAGNHDRLFEDDRMIAKELLSKYPNVIYLEDSGVELKGIKFWGIPVSRPFCN
ncbi:MAG: metallophosphoesterase [Patescibacteria group bacterium]|nr:metallophosphoesterase [Patescibacteria group bacterium]